jgi:superfamily II DNA or RNA helicase
VTTETENRQFPDRLTARQISGALPKAVPPRVIHTPLPSLKSLRSLKLPLTAAGKPGVVCREILAPLFEAATEAIVVCVDPTPEHLARMTWGMAPFVREGTKLTLVVMVSDPVPVETNSDALRRNWRESIQSQRTAERLSLYKYFAQEERFSLHVKSIASCEDGDSLRARLVEGTGIVLVTDTTNTMADVLWREVLHSEGLADVRADFRWSYGDPLKAVQNLHRSINSVLEKPILDPFKQIEETYRSLIELLVPPKLPWEETFDDTESPRIALYAHQQRAVTDWFENNCRGIFKMCTGAGKTISSLAAVWRHVELARERGEPVPPVIVTVPTRVLADQWCQEIRKLGFDWPVQAYNSKNQWHPLLEACLDCPRDDTASFVVATYRTFADSTFQRVLERQQKRGQQALWIADELHNLAPARLMDLAKERANYFIARLGLSATPEIENEPERTERLMEYFGGIVGEPYELKHGIQDGVLCGYRYFPFPCYLNADLGRKYLELLQKIDSAESGGRTDIDLYREKRDLVRKSGIQVQAFAALLPELLKSGRRLAHTLVYCPPGYGSVTDSRTAEDSDSVDEEPDEVRLLQEVRETLLARRIEVSCILGETPGGERNSTLHEFAAGRIQVVCAIGCLDEGVDVPSIERAIVLSSVNRKKQFIQRRGRILRRSRKDPAKVAEIYDVIVLPHGSHLPASQAERLLRVELDRYQEFAQLAQNREDADRVIQDALALAVGSGADVLKI